MCCRFPPGPWELPACGLPAQQEQYQQTWSGPSVSSGWDSRGPVSSTEESWGRTPAPPQHDDQIWETEVLSGAH